MDNNADVMYRLLVQSVTDYAIYMLTPDGIVANWNMGAQRAKGYRAEEILGQHFSLFYSAQERQMCTPDANLGIALKTGRFEDEGWRYRKDGSAFWAHVIIDAIHNEQGKLLGFAKITRDITERRESEMQLMRARDLAEAQSAQLASVSRFLDNIIENIPSCVLVEDAITREILLVNDKAEQLFGLARNLLLHKRPHECMSPELSDYFNNLADIALRNEGVHQREQLLLTPNGERMLHTRATAISGQDARQNYVMLIVEDVTDQRAADARIYHMAHHDNLTSLPNRILFRQRLSEALRSDSRSNLLTATFCLDLDNFKNVNDALGHQVGDGLLQAVAKRLRHSLRDQDTLARIGGDEFAIVLPALSQREEAGQIARRLIETIRQPINVEGHSLSVGLSVGIVLTDITSLNTPEQMLRCADMALYEAKRNGRDRYEYYTLAMDEQAHNRRVIENDLRDAISSQQLKLYYQPITNGDQSSIISYEALMRWHHPVKGVIMPDNFIPVAEETGLIHMLGAWALYEACREAASWEGKQSVSVNLSSLQFKNSALLSVVEGALQSSGLEPQRLEVEITESVLLDDTLGNIRILKSLKALGVQIALDDFGTGYSSLSYLRSFPFDKIKIDKSFINDMGDSREALAIIRAITGMSRSLDIQITAEGVENTDQFIRLREEGCTLFQGYLFGRPQPSEQRLKVLS
ncbi:putative bifunctional diguanylate cyclase/phosphodiesterase [[Erwinia] mediterraneensis]|uniref:putative bifunctional diguanylate cyclase/phosphodiesterase n=1 Tax=[Erwinia] mediterraneensis TaxID=2161819 RepID=UPI001030FB2A|nr:EAL domain-containing protein [[Erwinia] mediterraneensis]